MSEEIFMPFTVGGGVKTLDDVNALLRAGADKVSVNSEAVRRPEFVREAARIFGDQCMTVSIDYKKISPNHASVFIDGGREHVALDPIEWARRCEDLHCGEVLLGSIDRDGTMSGYDLEMIHRAGKRAERALDRLRRLRFTAACDRCAGGRRVRRGDLFDVPVHRSQPDQAAQPSGFSRGLDVRASASSRN